MRPGGSVGSSILVWMVKRQSVTQLGSGSDSGSGLLYYRKLCMRALRCGVMFVVMLVDMFLRFGLL